MRNEPTVEEQVERAVSDALSNHTSNLVLIVKAQMATTILSGLLAAEGAGRVEFTDMDVAIAGAIALAEKIAARMGLE